MKIRVAFSLILAVAILAVATTGCGGKRLKGLVPAHGVVTLNGEPVAGASVIFAPTSIGGEAVSATATTNDKGEFKMTTLDPGDGVYPTEYVVTVAKDVFEGGLSLEEAKAAVANPEEARKNKKNVPEQTVIHHVPVQYSSIQTSGLKITVPAKGDKEIKLELVGEVDLTPQKMGGH